MANKEVKPIKYCPIFEAVRLILLPFGVAGADRLKENRCRGEACLWYGNGCPAHPRLGLTFGGPKCRYDTTSSSPSTEAIEKQSISS